MTNADSKLLTITEVSRITGYCVSYLRELTKRGVVKPRRTSAGIRLFSCEDVAELKARRDRLMWGVSE